MYDKYRRDLVIADMDKSIAVSLTGKDAILLSDNVNDTVIRIEHGILATVDCKPVIKVTDRMRVIHEPVGDAQATELLAAWMAAK